MDQLRRETQPPAGTPPSPVPQYWNPDTEKYERVLGAHGAPRAMLYGPNGQPISASNRLPVDVGGQIHADVVLGDVTVQIGEVQQGKRGQNAEPWEVTLTGSSLPPTLVFIDSDTVVPAGTSVTWSLSSSERAEINRWPVFAIAVSWKFGSTDLDYTVSCWQYLPNHESGSTPVPSSVDRIDNWSGTLSDRIFVARIRRFAMENVILRVTNHSPYDQILSNFCVQCMIEGV